MKQVVQNLKNGKTEVIDVPIPKPKPGTALVHNAVSLVSAGTERMVVEFAEKSLMGKARSRPELVRQLIEKAQRDGLLTALEAALARLDQPLALGYSSAGNIVALGEEMQGFKIGQRVACSGGGYAVHAEYCVVPRNLLTPLPAEVDFESAAFATLGAIALHGFRISQAQLGESVLVIGLGLLGLLAGNIALAAGCQALGVDLDAQRVQLAQHMGVQALLRSDVEATVLEFTHRRGCDAVLICADTPSNDPIELAGKLARDRARIVVIGSVGMQIPRKTYYEKELSLMVARSYGPGRYDPQYEEKGQDYPIGYVRWTEGRNLEAFVNLLASKRLDVHPLITHRFPIEQATSAYDLITGKRQEFYLGILLTYPDHPNRDNLSLLGEGVTIPSPIQPQHVKRISPVKSKIGLGVLGAGNFANAVLFPILRNIKEIERVGVASGSGLSAEHAARRYGFRYSTTDENTLFNDEQINLIAILTRHHLHAKQTVAALRAGKHVFCEKPLAIQSEELPYIIQALEEQSQATQSSTCLLTVGFNRRFAPLTHSLKTFLTGSQEPMAIHYRINAGYLPREHWLHDLVQGGGRIIGEVCHFVDFLTFLVGKPPVAVTAQGIPDDGRYREDNVMLGYTFPDGSIGNILYLANGDRSFAKERIEVFTAGRVAVLDDFRTLTCVYQGKRKTIRSFLRQDKGHLGIWKAFTQAILFGGAPPIPYEHLFGVARATFAAVEALRRGEKIIIQ